MRSIVSLLCACAVLILHTHWLLAADPSTSAQSPELKVKVALALQKSDNSQYDKVKKALAATAPKGPAQKVREALLQKSEPGAKVVAPMPREKISTSVPCECCGPDCKCAPCRCLEKEKHQQQQQDYTPVPQAGWTWISGEWYAGDGYYYLLGRGVYNPQTGRWGAFNKAAYSYGDWTSLPSGIVLPVYREAQTIPRQFYTYPPMRQCVGVA